MYQLLTCHMCQSEVQPRSPYILITAGTPTDNACHLLVVTLLWASRGR